MYSGKYFLLFICIMCMVRLYSQAPGPTVPKKATVKVTPASQESVVNPANFKKIEGVWYYSILCGEGERALKIKFSQNPQGAIIMKTLTNPDDDRIEYMSYDGTTLKIRENGEIYSFHYTYIEQYKVYGFDASNETVFIFRQDYFSENWKTVDP